MSDTTSPGLEEWASHTEPRSPVQPQRAAKRRRTGSHGANQEIGIMRNGGKSGLPRFIGSGSGIHFIRTVYDVLARNAIGTRPIDRTQARGDLVPGEDDELIESAPEHIETPGTRSRAPFWRQDEIVEEMSQGAPPITFDNLVQWTKSYFENWHPAFPFLHGPEVLETFEQVASVGIGNISTANATIVRCLVSISLADSRQMDAHQAAVPTSLVFSNQEHIASSMVFALGCPASLKSVQAAVCVQLFLVSMLKFNMASRLGGIIVRMSFHLGLHRCPVRYPNFSTHEAVMRKRVWWSIYCLERVVCQSLGHPLGIVDDDSDVCLPSQECHSNTPPTSLDDSKPRLTPITTPNLNQANALIQMTLYYFFRFCPNTRASEVGYLSFATSLLRFAMTLSIVLWLYRPNSQSGQMRFMRKQNLVWMLRMRYSVPALALYRLHKRLYLQSCTTNLPLLSIGQS